MRDDANQHFIAGLKAVIKKNWKTQEAFVANKVTSKVYLSKILTGNARPSYKMMQALSERAGVSIEDIVALGKKSADTQAKDSDPAIVKPISFGAPFDADALSGMTSTEILSKISNYSMAATENVETQIKSMAATIKALVDERNRLLELWQEGQYLGSFLEDSIKIVTKDFIIDNCNRTYSRNFKQVVGDTCAGGKCICATDCLAQKAFAKGGSVSSQILHEDHPYFVTAYLMSSSTGINDKAIVTIRDLQWVWDGLENGDIIHSRDGFQPEENSAKPEKTSNKSRKPIS